MFFTFLTLRETPRGTIEPDILPSSSSTNGLITPKAPSWATSSFRTYITTWDFSDRPAILRRFICLLAFVLHTPLNVISIISWGISLWIFVGIILSVLNLVCVGAALWKLDVMSGERRFYGRILKRRNFDYVILGLVIMYGGAFGILLFAHLNLRRWVFFVRVVWPCLIATDIICFISGWVATWRDVSLG